VPPHDHVPVYITGIGRIPLCKRCGAPRDACRCDTRAAQPQRHVPDDGYVRLSRERKGRGGKIVTCVTGVPLDEAGLQELAQTLKRYCGAGGTVRERRIELQGDLRERLEPKLIELGYRVKRVGG
jgi:translation initiation factor 1